MLPRRVSRAIGAAGTWLAWRLMPDTRKALADNLRALFPAESSRALEERALRTLRAYANDVIDFLRAIDLPSDRAEALFEYNPADARLFVDLLERQRGVILVGGHYGNWELGSVAMRHVFKLPLTIVAMAEESEEVNGIRRDIRARLGAETLEVRRSLDTALQLRKRLAENTIIAMLIDRYVGRDRVAVRFLGRDAWFLKTPALLAYLTGAPLVPCFIERLDDRRFSIAPGEPIIVSAERPRERAIEEATQRFAQQLEARIRRQPQFWYQFYRYWDAQQLDPDV